MKRYLVFAYDHYYPSGGVNDLIERFDNEEEALAFCINLRGYDTWHIYDQLEDCIL